MNKNYIVLNGKHYDATTGAPLKPTTSPNHSHATHKRTTPSLTTRRHTQPTSHARAAMPAKKTTSRTHHGAPTALRARKPEHPKTLMRRSVQKPTHAKKTPVKAAYPLAKTTPGAAAITPKKSVTNIDSSRLHRAKQTSKSHRVSRFGSIAKPSITTHVKPVAIKPAPAHTAQNLVKPRPSTKATAANLTPAAKKTAMLEQALANAKSHEQPVYKPAKTRRFKHQRLMSSLAGLTAVLLVVGFVAYLNKASVELQVASVRAGFQASLPNYAPTGYQRQAAQASDGKVAISFLSPNQKESFTLTQEASSWDSQTLFDSIVAQDNATYQTVQSHGRTIYIYGDDKAAWVDGGILYKVAGNAKLNSDQIISLATSM